MFDNYLKYAQEAKEKEQEIIEKYDKFKEELAVELKEKTISELNNIEEILLKDYSPIQFHNTLTIIVNNHKKLNQEKKKELDKVKEDLDNKLNKIIDKPKVTEMYKIIHSINGYTCRVWFTLIPIEKWNCKEGDPIRVEWLHLKNGCGRLIDNSTCIDQRAERTGPGNNGLEIPQFNNSGTLASANAIYHISSFGKNSPQEKWWDEWVEKNRPC